MTTVPATPCLVVDRQRLEHNLARTAALAAQRGLALRPHAKTHKSPRIGLMQLASGAVGLTVATVGEAEVFADAGVEDLFVAYPLWVDEDRAGRLRALLDRARVSIGIDSVEGARAAARVPGLAALVEVDSGQHRTGVPPEEVGPLAAAAREAGLEVLGAFTFPGHSYAPGGRAAAAQDEAAALAAAAASLTAAGVEPRVLSGGSTPSLAETVGAPLSEVRPGVSVFGDAQQWELGAMAPEEIALTAHATVVSHAGGRLVLDAGSKVLGADRAAYATGFGRLLDHPDARITQLSEHHAVVEHAPSLPLGSVVRVVPNHVCAAVNLADRLRVEAAGEAAEWWPVAARGANT